MINSQDARLRPRKNRKIYYVFALLVLLAGISKAIISCTTEKVIGSAHLQADGLHVPDGFVIERAVPSDMVTFPYFATLDNQGRLFVVESSGKTTSTEDVLKNPTFKILLLQDLDGDGIFDKRQVFADKIPYPMGGTFYRGSFYATAPPDLIRFTDTDGDGISDKREVILSGWVLSHNAATLSGPFLGPDGRFYMCDARRGFDIKTLAGTEWKGKGARIWRCRPDGSELESYSGGGFDNSVELIFMPSGETVGTMTYFVDPTDGQRDALMHWVEGGVYPKPYPVIEEDHLKLTGDLMPVMTKLPRVAPAGLMRYRGSVFGKAYEGNLFSAQFNTGRIMRHVITPSGATFKTVDEPFMRSDSLDTHPTDVLEDADGSLIVVNTGGWFIAGCPLSVVAKTDVAGGIFRMRKTGAPVIRDPWGKQLDYKKMSAKDLSALLTDPRMAVTDNAMDQLISTGDAAIEDLKHVLQSSPNEELRAAIVFALYRIQTTRSIDVVIGALNDRNVWVRTAAARVLGLAQESKAVDKLLELLQKDLAPVRRQAATALGQIGDKRALDGLIAASANPDDRFVEHAILYSLITLNNPEPLIAALKNPAENIRRSALIALDQMDDSTLKKTDLVAFLESKTGELQQIGTWVASHHPGWSDIVITFLRSQLKRTDLSEGESVSLTDLMVRFCDDKPMQIFISTQLANADLRVATKLLMLDAISRCPSQQLPQTWITQLRNLLQRSDILIRSKVMDVIQSRSLPQLNSKLQVIINNPKESIAFRLKALNARVMSGPKLSATEFKTLTDLLDPRSESPVRQSAARLLAQAELSDTQLVRLANEEIPTADIFILPSLVNCFEGNKDEDAGQALITALSAIIDRLDNLSVPDLQKLFDSYPADVKESAAPLMKTLYERQAMRLSQLQNLEAQLHGGDVGAGRKLFFGKAICSTCHAVAGNGGDFGPDLTNIGEIRSKHDILEAIMFPSASFAREYETSKVTTKTNSYTGIITDQLPETIMVKTGPGTRVRVARNEITAIEPQKVSLMLAGLHQQLTIVEMADLMSYLTTLPDGLAQIKKVTGE